MIMVIRLSNRLIKFIQAPGSYGHLMHVEQIKIRMSSVYIIKWKHYTEITKAVALRNNAVYHQPIRNTNIMRYTEIHKYMHCIHYSNNREVWLIKNISKVCDEILRGWGGSGTEDMSTWWGWGWVVSPRIPLLGDAGMQLIHLIRISSPQLLQLLSPLRATDANCAWRGVMVGVKNFSRPPPLISRTETSWNGFCFRHNFWKQTLPLITIFTRLLKRSQKQFSYKRCHRVNLKAKLKKRVSPPPQKRKHLFSATIGRM